MGLCLCSGDRSAVADQDSTVQLRPPARDTCAVMGAGSDLRACSLGTGLGRDSFSLGMPWGVLTQGGDDVCQLARGGHSRGKHLEEPGCHCSLVFSGEPVAFKVCVGAPACFPKDGAGLSWRL